MRVAATGNGIYSNKLCWGVTRMDRVQIARQVFSEFAPLFRKVWGYHDIVEETNDNEICWRGVYQMEWSPCYYDDPPKFPRIVKSRVVCWVNFSDPRWTVIQVWGRNYWTRAKRRLESIIRKSMAQGFLAMLLDEIEAQSCVKERKGNTLFFVLEPELNAYLPVTFKFNLRGSEITTIVPTMTDKRVFKYPIQRETRLVRKILKDIFSIAKELSERVKALGEL